MIYTSNLKKARYGDLAALAGVLLSSGGTVSAAPMGHPSLVGTWTLVAADKVLPDGTRVHEYGEHPKGRLIVDEKGRYSLQIFDAGLPNFAGDESEPTPKEYRDAMEAASVHFGTISADWTKHTVRIAIDGALYP